MEKQKIYSQHLENNEWFNKLAFYQDEIKMMNNRIAEIAAKNTSKDTLARVEHFQNQLIIQKNNVDEIKHLVTINEDSLRKEVNNNATAVDHRSVNDHSKERELVTGFEKNFNELRHELNSFLSKNL